MNITTASKAELQELLASLRSQYEDCCKKGLKLDMSRGKPGADQLDISEDMLTVLSKNEQLYSGGTDVRNYGLLFGIPECRKLFAEIFEVPFENVIAGGNASLTMMYDTMMRLWVFGAPESERPWNSESKVKWLCPVPGYDRHFSICQQLGMEMINIPMTENGPDMDMIEKLVSDETVKGIWCVPKYSNPEGHIYSDDTVRRLASMKTAAKDFRIFWDNAYIVHHLTDERPSLLNIFDECAKSGNPDRVLMFTSTSKITFPGGGVAMLAASEKNLAQIATYLGVQTIGYDKLNQLRHTTYFKDKASVERHMKILADFIGRKFDITLNALSELSGLGIAEWTNPKGGYFISLDVMEGTAKRVYDLAKEAGVTLTTVGATYPYGIDPKDRNLRIAPTYPTDDEVRLASRILVLAVKLAAIKKLM